jgi:hypothetical protein
LKYLWATLAVLLPAAVVAASLAALTQRERPELSPAAAEMEAALEATQPDVLLVGNSLVGHGVDDAALGRALDDASTLMLWEAATRPANWYAVLKNRVYENGYTPHLVVIPTTPRMLLQTRLSSDKARKSLADHATDYEPVINARVYGRESEDSLFIHRIQEGRGVFQERFQAAVRDWTVGLLFAEPGEGGLSERGQAVAGPALEAVFSGDGAVDMSLHHRVIPVLQDESDRVDQVESRTVSVAESFVPDLIDLVLDNDSRLVFVWIPVSERETADAGVDAVLQAELITLLNEQGVGWLDLHDLGYGDQLFKDAAHLNSQGRAKFTAALARSLVELDAMGDGPLPAAGLPLVLEPALARRGEPPALPALALSPKGGGCVMEAVVSEAAQLSNGSLKLARLGPVSPLVVLEDGAPLAREVVVEPLEAGCDGRYTHPSRRLMVAPSGGDPDGHVYSLALSEALPLRHGAYEAWWVYPGTALTMDFPGWPGEEERLTFQVYLEAYTSAQGTPTVTLDGRPLTLTPEGRWLRAEGERARAEGAFSLEIASPADGPFLTARWIHVEGDSPERGVDLAGEAALVTPAQASLLPGMKDAPPSFTGGDRGFELASVEATDRGVGRAELPQLAGLGHQAVAARTLCRFCSPIVITEDGAPLPRTRRECAQVRPNSKGRYCLEDGVARFTSTDGADPVGGGHTFGVAYDADHLVKAGWWLYPGDRMRYEPPAREIRNLVDGAHQLRLKGIAAGPGAAGSAVAVTLTAGGETRLEAEVAAADLERGVELPLEAPINVTDRVSFEVETRSEGVFVLLMEAALEE